MFDQLYARPRVVARHRAGPLLEERLRYLASLVDLGMRRTDLQIRAHYLLVIARFLPWQIDLVKPSLATRSKKRRSSGPSNPNLARFLELGEPASCSLASPSPGFGSWGDSSQ